MASMQSIIGSQEKEDETRIFLYVIQPVQNVDEVNEDQSLWRGKVHHMQDQIRVRFQDMTKLVTDKNDHMQGKITELKESFKEQLSLVQKTIEEKMEALFKK